MAHAGLRPTAARQHVYDTLRGKRDHPTAIEVFMRAKETFPSLSLATVYNCLELLSEKGLIRPVHVDREPTRYCANLHEHGHFVCNGCGELFDVEFTEQNKPLLSALPEGFVVESFEVTLRGRCAQCTSERARKTNPPRISKKEPDPHHT